jgi:hypothetical protein
MFAREPCTGESGGVLQQYASATFGNVVNAERSGGCQRSEAPRMSAGVAITNQQPDWDTRSEDAQGDRLAAYDKMREQCPVANSDFWGWSLFRHEDVVRVLNASSNTGQAPSLEPNTTNSTENSKRWKHYMSHSHYLSRDKQQRGTHFNMSRECLLEQPIDVSYVRRVDRLTLGVRKAVRGES